MSSINWFRSFTSSLVSKGLQIPFASTEFLLSTSNCLDRLCSILTMLDRRFLPGRRPEVSPGCDSLMEFSSTLFSFIQPNLFLPMTNSSYNSPIIIRIEEMGIIHVHRVSSKGDPLASIVSGLLSKYAAVKFGEMNPPSINPWLKSDCIIPCAFSSSACVQFRDVDSRQCTRQNIGTYPVDCEQPW